MKVELSKTFRFEAAHYLPKVPPEHKCSRLHGHAYSVELIVEGEVDPETGWLIDFAVLRDAWLPLGRTLDHHCLNDIEGLENPTSELIAVWIARRLEPQLPMLSAVVVHESEGSRARYRLPKEE